jgi:hypothetical protein
VVEVDDEEEDDDDDETANTNTYSHNNAAIKMAYVRLPRTDKKIVPPFAVSFDVSQYLLNV